MKTHPLILGTYLLLLVACQSPWERPTSGPGTVTVSFAASRTVVADWAAQATSYKVTLTSLDGFPSQTQTVTSGSAAFSAVAAGTWNIAVQAFKGGLLIGDGSVSHQTVAPEATLSVSVILSANQTGWGDFRYRFSFPASVGITDVWGKLYNSDDQQVASYQYLYLTDNGTLKEGTIIGSSLSSGRYRLELDFRRASSSAGVFSEGVNVWGNLTSDQWLAEDGSLHERRVYAEADFNSTDTSLANLVFQSGGSDLLLTPLFFSANRVYATAPVSALTVTATRSLGGQSLEYRLEGGTDWTSLSSGVVSSAVTVTPTSVLEVRVTANDQVHQKVYRLQFTSGNVLYSANGATGGSVPNDPTTYASGALATVVGNTGALERTGYQFAAWNTQADGSGTTYAVGTKVTAGTGPITLHAIWLPSDFTFTASGNSLSVTRGAVWDKGDVVIPGGVTSLMLDDFGGSSAGILFLPSSLTTLTTSSFTSSSRFASFEVAAANAAYQSIDGVIYNKTGTTLLAFPRGRAGVYTIPSTVTSVGANALANSSKLTAVVVPDSITSIGNAAFKGCTALTSVSLPPTVTSLGTAVFSRCTSLTSVVVPASFGAVPTETFSDCTSLANVSLAPGIPALSSSVFRYCTSLSTIDLPASVTSVGSEAFAYSGLTSFTASVGLTTVGSNAFSNCTKLTSVSFVSVTAFPSYTFRGCSSLVSVDLGALVTLNTGVFGYCTALTAIHLPASLTSCSTTAFEESPSMVSITVDASNSVFQASGNLLLNKAGDKLILAPNGIVTAVVPEGVTSIGSAAFAGRERLTSVSFPSSLVSIGHSAFLNCRALTAVILPPTVRTLEISAFSGCSALASVNLGGGVTTLGGSAFSGCTVLAAIALPDTLTTMGSNAFTSCPALTSIAIPASVTTVPDYAFRYDSGLVSVTLPEGVKTIGASAFDGCVNLTQVTLPASLTSLGDWSFSWCDDLTSVTSLSLVPPVISASARPFGTSLATSPSLLVPADSVSAYQAASGWSFYTTKITAAP